MNALQLPTTDDESYREPPPDRTDSGFLKLPGELRTEVYELLLESMPKTINIPLSRERLMDPWSTTSHETGEKVITVLSMASTCRTVRKELLSMFYGGYTFKAAGMLNLGSLMKPLRLDALAMLEDVRIGFPVDGYALRDKSPHKTLWYVHDKYGKGALRMDKVKVTLVVRDEKGENNCTLASLDELGNYKAVYDHDGWVIKLK